MILNHIKRKLLQRGKEVGLSDMKVGSPQECLYTSTHGYCTKHIHVHRFQLSCVLVLHVNFLYCPSFSLLCPAFILRALSCPLIGYFIKSSRISCFRQRFLSHFVLFDGLVDMGSSSTTQKAEPPMYRCLALRLNRTYIVHTTVYDSSAL